MRFFDLSALPNCCLAPLPPPLSSQGGGIFSRSGVFGLLYTTIVGCRAEQNGGGLHAEDTEASIVASVLRANTADRTGGANFEVSSLNANAAVTNLTDVSFEHNVAEQGSWRTASALAFTRTRLGYVRGVSFAGNLGVYSMRREAAPGPRWLCQPGHYMPDAADFTIPGNFTGCNLFPCAPGYFGRQQDRATPSEILSPADSCTGQPASLVVSSGGRSSPTCDEPCPPGHYCPEGTSEPLPCPSGTSNRHSRGAELDDCRPCFLGQFQPETAATNCSICPAGTYSAELGQTECADCPKGGYCRTKGAVSSLVWQACPAGSFNPHSGSTSSAACELCPPGTSSLERGANSSATCKSCARGTYAIASGQAECQQCPAGTSSSIGAKSCEPCAAGAYAAFAGMGACVPCPHPLYSTPGSVTCAACKPDFYLVTDGRAELLTRPTEHCKPCPVHANCSAFDTSLASLGVPRDYWRASTATAELHRCRDSTKCVGSTAASGGRALAGHAAAGDMYCEAGHAGPRCESCIASGEYFSRSSGGCATCPDSSRFAILAGVVAGAALLLVGLKAAVERLPRSLADRLSNTRDLIGVQPKLKVLISFYQVCATLTDVYGVRLDDEFTGWLDFVDVIGLDLLDLIYPGSCLGSMKWRLLFSALWPYAAFLLLSFGIAVHALVARRGHEAFSFRKTLRTVLMRCLYALILIFYLVLPSVSRSIFKARQCESFTYDDETGKRISFLLADLSLTCNSGPGWSNESAGLQAYFWPLFVIWPVAVPIGFLMLLLPTRSALRRKRITMLARASSFLWRDYEPALLFWEVIDMYRKVPSPESRQMEHALTPPFPPGAR